jgi:putative endonuclease
VLLFAPSSKQEAQMAAKDELGREGERAAADYLVRGGYRIVGRNWRCEHGEIDIIAEKQRVTAFVEVKTRSSVAFGHPFEAITIAKLARLRRLAGAWCEQHGLPEGRIRIDVIAVIAERGKAQQLEHLEDVSR